MCFLCYLTDLTDQTYLPKIYVAQKNGGLAQHAAASYNIRMKLIALNKGKTAILDDEDFIRVNAHTWRFFGGYAGKGTNGKSNRCERYMHCFILGSIPEGLEVDHINGNPMKYAQITPQALEG